MHVKATCSHNCSPARVDFGSKLAVNDISRTHSEEKKSAQV